MYLKIVYKLHLFVYRSLYRVTPEKPEKQAIYFEFENATINPGHTSNRTNFENVIKLTNRTCIIAYSKQQFAVRSGKMLKILFSDF